MRYVNVLSEEFAEFVDEKRSMAYWLRKDPEYLPFDDMPIAVFDRKHNALAWLLKLKHPQLTMGGFVPTKLSATEIAEVVETIGNQGRELRLKARQTECLERRKSMQKTATKKINCGKYYRELSESGFFDDKEIRRDDLEAVVSS